jgi:hypothetical protein
MVLKEVDKATLRSEGCKFSAAYATVSYEWQSLFEKVNFRRLVLSSDDLEYFLGVVTRRHSKNPAYSIPTEYI